MPCFTWWWPEPAVCPGKKPGSDFAGSAQYTPAITIRAIPARTASGHEESVVPHRVQDTDRPGKTGRVTKPKPIVHQRSEMLDPQWRRPKSSTMHCRLRRS